MSAKRMLSLRLPPALADRIDRLAAGDGVTRTEWCSQALARQALRGASSPSPVDSVDKPQAMTG
jgi:hypothetical protein